MKRENKANRVQYLVGKRWSCQRSAGQIQEKKEEHLLVEKKEEEMIREMVMPSNVSMSSPLLSPAATG
ncbi:hypothetical protein ACLOJK_007685 [Asimina triloba]